MDKENTETIRSGYMRLSRCLKPEDIIQNLAQYFVDHNVFSQKECKAIMDHGTPTKKIYKLLDIISTKDNDAFQIFYNFAKENDYCEAADILQPWNGPHAGEPEMPLPDVWPDDEHMKSIQNGTIEVVKLDEDNIDHANMSYRFFNSGASDNYYDMSRMKRGKALIINNENFENMSERMGTNYDSTGLEMVLKEMGFEVQMEKNQTKEKAEKLIKEYCEMDHSQYNCFILVILSHGIPLKVCCTDFNPEDSDNNQKVLEILKIRGDVDKVKTLLGKPKLIFIQACQGKDVNAGMKIANAINFIEPDTEQHVDTALPGSENIDDLNMISPDGAGPSNKKDKVPKLRDTYVGMATTEGNISYRNTEFGSWYIQALIFVLANYSFKEELTRLMTKVSRLVTKATTGKDLMQVGEGKTTLTRDLFFFPGLPTSEESEEEEEEGEEGEEGKKEGKKEEKEENKDKKEDSDEGEDY